MQDSLITNPIMDVVCKNTTGNLENWATIVIASEQQKEDFRFDPLLVEHISGFLISK